MIENNMFGFIKKIFTGLLYICTIVNFSGSLFFNYKEPIKSVSLNNQLCQGRPTLVDINSKENIFFLLQLVFISVMEVVTLLMMHVLEFVSQIK